jgi:hypothetical protein
VVVPELVLWELVLPVIVVLQETEIDVPNLSLFPEAPQESAADAGVIHVAAAQKRTITMKMRVIVSMVLLLHHHHLELGIFQRHHE